MFRSRANSETDGRKYRDWISQAFAKYTIPQDSQSDTVDSANRNIVHDQSRYLGVASIQSNSFFNFNVMFYEITKSEISEIVLHSSDLEALPPKKRKRRNVMHQQVVFCLENNATLDSRLEMLNSRQYYLFPREAIVEALNETPPFEALISFHLPKGTDNSILHSVCSCHENGFKVEKYSNTNYDLPLHQRRRFTDPGLYTSMKSDCHVINIRLSGISNDLFMALKHTVSDFENIYGKMMELMKLHSQQLSVQKLDYVINNLDEEDIKFENMIIKHSHPSSSVSSSSSSTVLGTTSMQIHDWSSEEDHQDQDYVQTEMVIDPLISPPLTNNETVSPKAKEKLSSTYTKKCLYCGSKSTPMWRRGPQGAGTLCNACGVKWKHGKILCDEPVVGSDLMKKPKRKYNKKKKEDPVNNNIETVEAATLLTLLKRS